MGRPFAFAVDGGAAPILKSVEPLEPFDCPNVNCGVVVAGD